MFSKTRSTMLIALVILAIVSFVNIGYSQTETGQIAGTVSDPTGAILPNAKITVKSTTTGLERETSSTSSGTYAVTNLQPGSYVVRVEAAGFSTVQQSVNVDVGAKVGLDLKM